MKQSIVYTITANCQDCYRCVRACPVKAIKVTSGQAQISSELCIMCGTCVRECPQGAKKIHSSLDSAKELVNSNRLTVVSLAPSFSAIFAGEFAHRLPSALRRLGFDYIHETAEGAKLITELSFEKDVQGNICTACPAIVNYVEKYKPEFANIFIPIVSPMIAHGRLLKAQYPDCAVIFIGPCSAKKHEALRTENVGVIDVVLTFDELLQWFSQEDISLDYCSESGFDNRCEIGTARLFPLQGGMLNTGGLLLNGAESNVLHLSGSEDVLSLFDGEFNFGENLKLTEALFCKGGCINGAGITNEKNFFERRRNVIDYSNTLHRDIVQERPKIDFKAVFMPSLETQLQVPKHKIDKILEQTGKLDPAFQLNCGACGYKTCIDNAVAVAKRMAEISMCMPYMRRLAQQRTDIIIETMPSGVVILDSGLCILKMNPAFKKMFMCNDSILGRRISYLLNADGFEKIMQGETERYESIAQKYGIKYHEVLYPLREDEQYVGIYSDISNIKYDQSKLDVIKSQTLMHAREFLDHQIKFSQEMANYLGLSTAKSEEIAMRLINLYEDTQK